MDRIGKLQKKARDLTAKPGVYFMKNIQNEIIYIGKAKSLKKRVSSYFRKNAVQDNKVKKMVSQVEDFDFIVTDSEFEALLLECTLIKQYQPKYNILLKDDKGYYYILITKEAYPRILAVKQKTLPGTYIGPYTSSFSVKQMAEEVNRVFQLPTCRRDLNKKSRPCLNYQIKRCSGVCRGHLTQEEYRERIEQAVSYIKKGSSSLLESLKVQMEEASKRMDYEKAMQLRDRIRAIERVNERQKIYLKKDVDLDVIATVQNEHTASVVILKFRHGRLVDKEDYLFHQIYDLAQLRNDFLMRYYSEKTEYPGRIYLEEEPKELSLIKQYFAEKAGHSVLLQFPKRGEGAKLIQMAQSNAAEQLSYAVQKQSREIAALDELARTLGLKESPRRIEAYDISNLKDSGIVGGMVVFENGLPKRSDYKRFKIQGVCSQDDYASMREMITRRFTHYLSKEEPSESSFRIPPDLLLIDGGTQHLQAVSKALKNLQLDIPCFGMVKDSRHRTRAIASSGGEISITGYKSAFQLVTRIQDEVHRFTLSYQKKTRKKQMLQLELTQIPGIGEKKALALYRHFKTKSALRKATPQEIGKIAKINQEKAKEILSFLTKGN